MERGWFISELLINLELKFGCLIFISYASQPFSILCNSFNFFDILDIVIELYCMLITVMGATLLIIMQCALIAYVCQFSL